MHNYTYKVTMKSLSGLGLRKLVPLELVNLARSQGGHYRQVPLWYFTVCTKNETMAPLHVATLTVQRELPIKSVYVGVKLLLAIS